MCISFNVRLLLAQSVRNFFDTGLLVISKRSYYLKKQLIDLPPTRVFKLPW